MNGKPKLEPHYEMPVSVSAIAVSYKETIEKALHDSGATHNDVANITKNDVSNNQRLYNLILSFVKEAKE